LHDAVFDVPYVLKLLTIDFIAMIVGASKYWLALAIPAILWGADDFSGFFLYLLAERGRAYLSIVMLNIIALSKFNNSVLSNPIEVPSPAELDEIDRRESQAIESLEISNDSVKCQKCSIALPLLETSSTVAKPKTSRMLRTISFW
jgi:hypothetical protein